jgi:class 3 adenylate cyclase
MTRRSQPAELTQSAREITAQLEETGVAAELVDPDWRLVWVSPQLRALTGAGSDEELGLGRHIVETRTLPAWWQFVSDETALGFAREVMPYIADGTPGGLAALREVADSIFQPVLSEIEPKPMPPLFIKAIEFQQGDLPPLPIHSIVVRLSGEEGDVAGILLLYVLRLPASVLALVARGDEAMFARMAELTEPAPRPAAILFTDLESSGALSRRLASAAYFRLLQEMTTAIDDAVASECGIVGKHAGDGVTAFFLSDQLGSDSAAATAALRTARRLPRVAADAAEALAAEGVELDSRECRLNVAVHWSGGLYIGQIVTGGRLEVTALGDEVNECARIEQSARGGAILASKGVIERLTSEDAAAVGIDAPHVTYRALAELEGVDAKARRDAGIVAVARLDEQPEVG